MMTLPGNIAFDASVRRLWRKLWRPRDASPARVPGRHTRRNARLLNLVADNLISTPIRFLFDGSRRQSCAFRRISLRDLPYPGITFPSLATSAPPTILLQDRVADSRGHQSSNVVAATQLQYSCRQSDTPNGTKLPDGTSISPSRAPNARRSGDCRP